MTDLTAHHLATWAAGWGEEAAVWLLTKHGYWLPELHRSELITPVDPEIHDATAVNWRLAASFSLMDEPPLTGTCAQWQILRVACCLTGRHALSWSSLSTLDDADRPLVLHAVAWAMGGPEYARQVTPAPSPASSCLCHGFTPERLGESDAKRRLAACTGCGHDRFAGCHTAQSSAGED